MENDQSKHEGYRSRCVKYIQANREHFEPFLYDETFDEYVSRMAEDGEWGGNLELQALSQCYNVIIKVYQFNAPTFQLATTNGRTVHLSYHNGEHYNSVVPCQEVSILNISKIDHVSKSEKIVMQSTGIEDLELIRDALAKNKQNVDSTIEDLIARKFSNLKVKKIEPTEREQKIINKTGFDNVSKIRSLLKDWENDFEAVIDYILANREEIEAELESIQVEDQDEMGDLISLVMETTQCFDMDKIQILLNDNHMDVNRVCEIILKQAKERKPEVKRNDKRTKLSKEEEEQLEQLKKSMGESKIVNI